MATELNSIQQAQYEQKETRAQRETRVIRGISWLESIAPTQIKNPKSSSI